MTAMLRVTCPKGHSHTVLLGMPNLETISWDDDIAFEENCPECGQGRLMAPGGYYEKDEANVMRRTGDYRPPDIAGVC